MHKLVDLLAKRTEEGEIDWKETPKSNSYQADFTNYSLIISLGTSSRSGEGEPLYILNIIGPTGATIESVDDEELSSQSPENSYYTRMKEIYEIARRRASGADAAIDALIDDLSDIPF